MKASFLVLAVSFFGLFACQSTPETATSTPLSEPATETVGQANVVDDVSQKDIVKVAAGSQDHTTLVAALKAADYVNVLSNAGPFTVFAPVNAAFDKLPAGTLDNLLKPEQKDALRTILEYHVYVGVLKPEMLQDGQVLGQASGHNATIANKDGKLSVNGANIVASIPASNGIIHVIDAVLLPPSK